MNKIIRGAIYVVCLYTCLVLQTTLAGYLAVKGATPDFLLLFTLCVAFELEGISIVMAAVNGFCLDMLSIHNVNGLYMLMFPCLAFIVDIFRKGAQGIFKYMWLAMGILVGSLVCNTLTCAFTAESMAQFLEMVTMHVLPKTAYNMALAAPYLIVRTIIVGVQDNRRKRAKTIY
ncbi:MAG: rod shape-determining protein MreD [Clostridia bacterium]|nr:rod shape-determining protein MreD [Clostridia bacterium]